MSRRAWRWVRVAVAAAVLAGLVWRVGAGAFVTGLRRLDASALLAAVGLNAVATVACAWRWHAVAAALGARLSLPSAIAAYYRAQFLNTTLPGGVLGDVHRGLRHGREVADVGRGLRSVAWERGIGQGVQVVVVVVVLALFPSPMRAALPYVLLAAGALALVAAAGWTLFRLAPPRWSDVVRADARALLTDRAWWPGVAGSVVAVAAHGTTFIVASRTAGAAVSWAALVPLTAVVLLAMAVPANIGGWGPREGAAAWAFAAAGMTAAQGVAAATVYGVLVLVASLPGAAVLIAPRRRVRARSAAPLAARVPVGNRHG